jgi:hypothetical protein
MSHTGSALAASPVILNAEQLRQGSCLQRRGLEETIAGAAQLIVAQLVGDDD